MSDIARKQLRQRLEMTGVEEYKPSTAQLPTASYMPVAEFSLLRWVAQHVGDPVAHNHNEQLRKSQLRGYRVDYGRRLQAALEASGLVITLEFINFVDALVRRLDEGSLAAELAPEIMQRSIQRYLSTDEQLARSVSEAIIAELVR